MQQPQYHQVQMQYSNQPPVTVVTHPSAELPDKYQSSALSQMRVLSIIQLVIGTICVILGITLAVLDFNYFNVFDYTHYVGQQGYGIWIGVYFLIVGGIGLGSVRVNSNGWIIANMILNIFCSVLFCWTLMGYASAGLVQTAISNCRFITSTPHDKDNDCVDGLINAYFALDSMLLILSFIQFIITIWSAALSCGAICFCCKNPIGGAVVQHQVFTAAVPVQTGVTIHTQQQYPTGVHQVPAGGYMAQPPHYMVSQTRASQQYQKF